jgi:hypothetical protein
MSEGTSGGAGSAELGERLAQLRARLDEFRGRL